MSLSSNKRHVGDHQAIDIISNLPESLLLHILSFVPTKYVVKTSILSKRWEYLWTKVPALDFTEILNSKDSANLTREQRFGFKKFVDKVLLLNDSTYLRRLRFHLFEDLFLGHRDLCVESWLDSIRRRKCREIYITLDSTSNADRITLPTGFLSSENLAVLKLDGRFTFKVPVCFRLPKLKIIHLIHIRFFNDELLKSLSLGCPVLKELLIMHCFGISTFYVESVTLKTLKLGGNIKPSKSSIVIKAPNLRHLHLHVHAKQYDICDLNLLETADLFLFDDKSVFQVLTHCSTVKSLNLGLDSGTYHAPIDVPAVKTFPNLTSLKLQCLHRILGTFLKCTPMLNSLTIDVPYMELNDPLDYTLLPELLPCLESVELQRFEGLEEEVEFVEYFLKAGPMLKKMKITYDSLHSQYESYFYKQLCKKLSEFPRSSPGCGVEVIPEPRCR